MRPHLALPLLLLAVTPACRPTYRLPTLDVEYQPPRGMQLITEEAGVPAVARFHGGLELRVVPGVALPIGTPVEQVLAAGNLEVPGTLKSAKVARLQVGPIGRYELAAGTGAKTLRTLVYHVPLEGRTLLVTLMPPPGWDWEEARVEASLDTLRSRK